MDKYITRGVHDHIPVNIQILLWNMVENREKAISNKQPKDYFNIFTFHQNGNTLQVKYTQERPAFEKAMLINNKILNIPSKVYVIREDDIDFSYYVMLLPDEY